MIEVLQYEFMRNALTAGVLVSIACGIIGTYVVVNKIVFISGGIAHASFGGIGLGYFMGFNPVLGAMGFSLVSALGMGLITRKTHFRADTIIGIMWAMGMALGLVFIDLTPGYSANLMSYLFGSILAVSFSDIVIILVMDIIIILITALLYKEFMAISFDEEFATIVGVSVDLIFLILLCLIAMTVVMLMRVVGLIMVIALLTIPAAISEQFTSNLKKMMLLSILFGVIFTTSGLWLSYIFDLTSGAMIIIVAGGCFILSAVYKKISSYFD